MTGTRPVAAFQDDLVTLMRKHQFRGVPARVSTTIKTAALNNDQQSLREWLPRAVSQMLKDHR